MSTAVYFGSFAFVRSRVRAVAASLLAALALLSMGAAAQNVVVTGSTGANASYSTLRAAFTAINANATQTGNNIAIRIVGNVDEGTTTATLNQPTGGSWNTLTISPSGGATRLISGATTAGFPLIDFNGADNVTINGLNSGGNLLLIANLTASASAGTATIRFVNGANGNTITNATIWGSSASDVSSNGATILFGFDTLTANGNDNNTISNSDIGSTGNGWQSKAILCNGSTATAAIGNSGLVIENNNIYDYFNATGSSAGVVFNDGCSASAITNNRFYQTGARVWTAIGQQYAILLPSSDAVSGVQAMTISGNVIGYASSAQSGVYALSGSSGRFTGIFLDGIAGGLVSNITNNTIVSVSLTGVNSSGTGPLAPLMGVYVRNGAANVSDNTIGSQSATGSITYSSSATFSSDVIGLTNSGYDEWTVNNNTVGGITASNTSTGAASVYGITQFSGGALAATMTGNVIGGTIPHSMRSTTTATASQVVGIAVASSIATINQNTVRNLSAAGGTGTGNDASVIGIRFSNGASVNTASRNTIFSLNNASTTAATTLIGMQFNGGTAGNLVARNLIHSIATASNSPFAEISGIRVSGGTTVYRNNMIAVGAGTAYAIGASLSGAGINGIKDISGSNSFFHNSIYVGGAATAGAGVSYAFGSADTGHIRSLRNNIFFNARSNSGATGKHYAVRVGGSSPNPAGLTINNNLYFANGTGAVLGLFNALDVANIAAWQTAVGQDTASFQSDPKYLAAASATPDLHIDPAATTVIEGAGVDVGVIDDFDGQTRSLFTPTDIGADARNFMNADVSGPDMTYTPLSAFSLGANRVQTVTMIEQTAVATGSVAPRIYFNKNAGSYVSTACTLATGTVQNGTWSCTIDHALLGGVVGLDVIAYFVVAQDTAAQVTANPSAGFAGSNVNTVTTAPSTPNRYLIAGNVSGSINVGAGGNFTSLTNAGGLFDAINSGTMSGNVTINLTSDLTTEMGSVALNQWIETGAGNYTLLIRPSGAPRTISGSNVGGLIRLNGADRVTIDGSTTGATASGVGGNAALRELTIQNINSSASAAVISVGSDGFGAQNNTVRNLNVIGLDPTSTLIGISLGGTVPGTRGANNHNNRVENCSIKRVRYGIVSWGATTANPSTGTVLTMNETSALTTDRVNWTAILVLTDNGAQITQNSINGISSANSVNVVGIAAGTRGPSWPVADGGVTSALIAGNKIDGVANLSSSGYSAAGIAIAGDVGGANTVVNNMITGVTSPAQSPDLVAGVYVAGVPGSVTRLHHNSVAMTGDRGAVAAQSPSYGVAISGVDPSVELKNNIFYTTQTAGAGGPNAKSYAIGTASTAFNNLDADYNDFFTSGANAGYFRSGSLAAGLGSDYTTLAQWQAATAKDGNSLALNPGFIDLANGNLHLNSVSSPLLFAGISGFATVDFDGQARPAVNPTIGADQVPVFNLTVSKSGTGMGTVTSGDGGISCGVTCTRGYVSGTTVTLTATATGGAVFTGWQGACVGVGSCLVTLNSAKAVTASFALSASGARILDINNDNQYLPESDGVLVLRYLFGLRGTALTNGLTLTGTRTTAAQIEAYLADILPYLDVDGNGSIDALTDGLLILRQLITPAGPLLIQSAIGANPSRANATDVRNYILTLRP